MRRHHDGRDQGERHQVREVEAAVEHVGEGGGRDARARGGDQERVPDSHGAPFPDRLTRVCAGGAVTALSGACGAKYRR